jgi:hypothetical protein
VPERGEVQGPGQSYSAEQAYEWLWLTNWSQATNTEKLTRRAGERRGNGSGVRVLCRIIGWGGALKACWEPPLTLVAGMDLMARPWWHRVWVMQELAVCSNPRFLCGNKYISTEHLESALAQYRELTESFHRLPGMTFMIMMRSFVDFAKTDFVHIPFPDVRPS